MASGLLDYTNPETLFWWHMTGFPLAVMLEQGGYDELSQYKALLFYLQHVVSQLGPPPTPLGTPQSWLSFMTDDHSPLELSWTWEANPRVRYAIEAIGHCAGSINDPYNQASTLELINALEQKVPEIDWQLFDLFHDVFGPTYESTSIDPDQGQRTSPTGNSSLMLAFEMWKGKIMAKAYIAPVKAYQLCQDPLDLATEAFQRLGDLHLLLPSYDSFLKFMKSDHGISQLTFLAVAVDCVVPCDSRFKLYVRGSQTAFSSVCFNLTMGQDDHPQWTDTLLSQLKELWYLVLGIDQNISSDEELSTLNHLTAGVLYNYDVQNGNILPDTKVYIPVRHYAVSDLEIATGLGTFLRRQGNDTFFHSYMQMLRRVGFYRPLEGGCGLQTYIACGVKRGELSLTSYLSPEIYHAARYQ
jgi:DMATS type aromatic prenyltransferase